VSREKIPSESAISGSTPASPPRERILAAARALFYARGIRAVGVDEIAAAAQTNKMTLYRHFESKDLLVAKYLRGLAQEADSVWSELARSHPGDALAQLHGWVERIGSHMADCGNRGCALANAAVEIPEKGHPARAVIEAHKTHQREHIATLCREAGYRDPERLADEIFLLLEGARVNMQSVGPGGPGTRVGEMLCALLHTSPRAAVAQSA
jgi:AcrR family transcriptional regulator